MKIAGLAGNGRITSGLLRVLLGTALLVGMATVPAWSADNGSDFYQGKTLKIIVPYGPGGGFDRWARLVGEYIKEPLGVSQVDVINQPGGGGLVGANTLYNAKPDGLTIGDIPAAGAVFADFNDVPGVEFHIGKFNWLGRPDNDPYTLFAHKDGSFRSEADLRKAKRPIKALATGSASTEYFAEQALFNTLDIPYRMVAAFSGSHQMRATFLSGNGDVLAVTAHHAQQMAKSASPLLVFSSEHFDRLPDTPTVLKAAEEYGASEEKRAVLKALVNILELGRAFVAPPGVPKERLDTLRNAFREVLHNPELVAAAEKAELYVGYESADQLKDKLDSAFDQKDSLLESIQSAD